MLRFTRVEASDVSSGDGTEADLRTAFAEMKPADLKKYQVSLKTNKGDLTLEFFPDKAPNHVRNFLTLSLSGYYKNKIFHRVIKDFMIQGGCPYGTGTGSHGPRIDLEADKGVKHERGTLSMARTNDPNSATCQFFICHKKAAYSIQYVRTTDEKLDEQLFFTGEAYVIHRSFCDKVKLRPLTRRAFSAFAAGA